MISLREEAEAHAKVPSPQNTKLALEELDQLHATGKISDTEYQDLRRRLLDRIGQP